MIIIIKVRAEKIPAHICTCACTVTKIIQSYTAGQIQQKLHLTPDQIFPNQPSIIFGPIPSPNLQCDPDISPKHPDKDIWDLGLTPIKVGPLQKYLSQYPDQEAAQYLSNGFQNGFRLFYTGLRLPMQPRNMSSAKNQLSELQSIIDKEIHLGRMAGPFDTPPISNLRCNPVGVLPKKDGSWRLITNLSGPIGNSVNDFIDPSLCSVSYDSFDHAISMIQKLGKGALLCKMDLSSAFRLIPIHPSDFCLLGIRIDDKYYIDKCMPFGCSIACSTFEKFSSFLHWLVSNRAHSSNIIHYLDDFLFAGKADTPNCSQLSEIFQSTCEELGVPINAKKTEGPTTMLSFLGLGIDTIKQTIFIPADKCVELGSKLTTLIYSKKSH
ncbi:uncharacterized protein LOC134250110 [Saccostrea cucullata]|uniref:uncharacterized protein LOC134250110 n=1 Tax=Saccostrea cuccullata TaxID=36930 RepID=UPI002ED595A6